MYNNELVVSTVPLKVSFTLPSNHLDKYSKTYRQLTLAQLQLAWEQTDWTKNANNNRFALLDGDKEDDVNDKDDSITRTLT